MHYSKLSVTINFIQFTVHVYFRKYLLSLFSELGLYNVTLAGVFPPQASFLRAGVKLYSSLHLQPLESCLP